MSDTDYSPPAKFLVPLKCRKKRKCSLSENIQEVTEGVQSEKKKFNFQKKRKHVAGYKCTQCSRVFNSKPEVNKHVKNVHTADPHQAKCSFCDKIIARKDNLKRHIDEVHGSGSTLLYCEQTECDKSFDSKIAFDKHISDTHVKKFMTCDICKADFRRNDQLQRHLRSVHVPRVESDSEPLVYRCECGKHLSNLTSLISHRKFCSVSSKLNKRSEFTLKQKRAAVRIIEKCGIKKTPNKLPAEVRNLVSKRTGLTPRATRRAFLDRKKLFAKSKTFTEKFESLDDDDNLDVKSRKLFGSVKSKNIRKRSGIFKRLPGGGRRQDDWWVRIKTELRKEFLVLRDELLAEVDTTILLECVYKIAGELQIDLNEVLSDTSDPRKALYKRLLNFLNEYNLARKKSNQQSHISPVEQGQRAGAMIRECRMLRENLGITDMECFDELRIYVCEMGGKGATTIHFVGAKDTFTSKYSNPKVCSINNCFLSNLLILLSGSSYINDLH